MTETKATKAAAVNQGTDDRVIGGDEPDPALTAGIATDVSAQVTTDELGRAYDPDAPGEADEDKSEDKSEDDKPADG